MPKVTLFRRALLAATATLGVGILSYEMPIAGHRASAATAPTVTEGNQFPGLTSPSEDSHLAFAGPGIVDKVVVKPGKVVKAGEIMATEDAREEIAKLKSLELTANSTREIRAAEADLKEKEVDYKRKKDLYADKIARNEPVSELDEAEVAVEIAKIVVEFRKEAKDKAVLDAAVQQVMVDKKQLITPIDGIVAKVDIHSGDGADISKPAMEVVQIDPLWVEVDLPSPRTKNLKVNQELLVRYDDEETWQKATITFLTPFADAGSDTRHVRLTMSNPNGREAGLPVMVQLPDNDRAGAR